MPIHITATSTLSGFEILLREFNGVSLDILNENPQLYVEFSAQILQEILALDSTGKVRRQGLSLAINFSAAQFLCDGTLTFLSQLYYSKKAFNHIVIELTESELDYMSIAFEERLLLCRLLGFKLAIDDFGVKASNFERVFALAPDFVKFDRSLIAAKNIKSLHALVKLCHDLNTKVIIEGVETSEHLDIAKRCQADYIQGYHVGRPVVIN